MKTKISGCMLSLVLLVLCCAPAYPWGWAAHTYVLNRAGDKDPAVNRQEVYGGMAADCFNYLILAGPQYQAAQAALFAQTHYQPFSLWEAAPSPLKPAAYGLASHNEAWGTDATAHIQNLTLGQGGGYVTIKAQMLADEMAAALQWSADPAPLLVISHELIEYGIDLLVKKELYPGVGTEMALAAGERSPAFPLLLAATYGAALVPLGIGGDEAAALILTAEEQFRGMMFVYGVVLSNADDAALMQGLVEFLLPQAQAFFSAYGIELPEEVDLAQVIGFGIGRSMDLCRSDYQKELKRTRSETVSQMAANGVLYRGMLSAGK